jgi:type II secretory pathway pseudopilin PulG
LFELLAVVVILATLAALVSSAVQRGIEGADATTTTATLTSLRDASRGFRTDVFAMPRSIQDLLRQPEWLAPPLATFDVVKGVGWRGPYVRGPNHVYELDPNDPLSSTFGGAGDLVMVDAWNRPIVLQRPDPGNDGVDSTDERYVRVVSAGPDRVLETPAAPYYPTKAQCGDDLVLYCLVADQRPL